MGRIYGKKVIVSGNMQAIQQHRLVRCYIINAHRSFLQHPFYHSLTYFDKGRNLLNSL